MRTALIDADILAYQAAVTAEQATDWGDGLWTLHAFEEEAIGSFDSLLSTLLVKVGATKFFLAFSDSTNWRKDILPTYKSNRSGTRKPMLLKALREYALKTYPCLTKPSLEGDDVIGIWATTKNKIGLAEDFIICSLDKDFRTIPGSHYNFGKDEFFEVSEHEADKAHMLQALTGDATDGYSGCPGVGPKTAEKILQAALDEGTPWADQKQLKAIYWKHIVKAYEKAGFGEEEALTQARVARILRATDYDDIQKRITLWTPT